LGALRRLMIGRSLSQVGQEVFLKEPKGKKFRVITVPPTALKKLQAHRKKQQAYRDHFGESYQGDYIFCNPDGSPMKPDTVSASVSLLFRDLKLPKGASLHSLRRGAPLGRRGRNPAGTTPDSPRWRIIFACDSRISSQSRSSISPSKSRVVDRSAQPGGARRLPAVSPARRRDGAVAMN
jgi:hypothetical protein